MAWLAPKPGGRYCDATLGAGGHALTLLERSAPDGRLIGLDRDPAAIATAGAQLERFGDRVTLVHARFSEARAVLERLEMIPIDGFLVDLGVSSPQLDRAERGFSFRRTGRSTCGWTRPRASRPPSCCRVDEEELDAHHPRAGEERHAARVARAIIERGARRRWRPRASWRRSWRGRCRATSAARTRRRGRSRRCASPSTTSWASWNVPGGRHGLPAAGRAPGGDRVPFAGGPDGEATAARAGGPRPRRQAHRRRGAAAAADQARRRAGRRGAPP